MLEILTDRERNQAAEYDGDDFVARFKRWAAIKTDAPGYTLTAAALQTLSLAAGDTTVMPPIFGGKSIHLNLYIMVVGPSTTMRKSTVLNFIRDLLPTNQQTNDEYIVILDDVSIQAFNKVIASQGKNMAPVLLSVDEVSGLFGLIRKRDSYLGGFDKTLMRAFDHSPVHIIRVNSKTDADGGAFVNVFAASTPEPLAEVLGSEDVESGLLPRFIVFDARDALRGSRIPLMERMKRHAEWEEIRDELAEFILSIARPRANGVPIGADQQGNPLFEVSTLPLTDEAFQRLDDIDALFDRDIGKDTTALGAIKGRAFWHVAKIAGLFALSRGGSTAKVELLDVLRAAWLIETTSADLLRMADEVGTNQHERLVNATLNLIAETKSGRMKRSAITRRLKLSAKDVRELLGTLIVRDLVKVSKDQDGEWWAKA